MGRLVEFPLNALSVTNDSDQDIFELIAGATWPFEFWGFYLSSALLTAEAVNLQLVIGRSSTGSGGGAVTGKQVDVGNSTTVRTTCNSLVTTPGSAGTAADCFEWTQLDRLVYQPVPQLRYEISAATRLSLHLSSAVGTTRTWAGGVFLKEIG